MGLDELLNELLEKVASYNAEAVSKVKEAYLFAYEAHINQKRESGEPYIVHPLAVALNLTDFYADEATLCAGLLHDVVEDTPVTLNDIENSFGHEVAHLVLGVTKISNMHFSTKDEATNANIRRLINSLDDDVRIMIIKLCDRLHNMRTLKFKREDKRIRSANETLHIFIPIAYFMGAFRLKCELEDICLSYLENDKYEMLKQKEKEILADYQECIETTKVEIEKLFKENNVSYDARVKVLNVYHIYEKINKGHKLTDLHDLVNFKIIVGSLDECYRVLGLIHRLYTPMNNKFKDYIALPKTNMYKSIHTTVFGPCNKILQFQIKTQEMDEVNTIGLAAYFKQIGDGAVERMQEELKSNYQFFNVIQDLNDDVLSDEDFIDRVKKEIFTSNIYVYTLSGQVIELPAGSTVIDFAYKIHTDIGNHLFKAYINGKQVKVTHKLNNKDRILLISKETAHPDENWLDHVVTSTAKRRIKEYFK